MTEQLARELFRTASEAIDVLAPPMDGVVAEARALRRRRRRIIAASMAGTVVVVGAVTWATTRSAESEPDPPPVVASPNPVSIAWYASGRLHLDDVAVELPQVTDLAEVAGGAVVSDETGAISFVSARGVVTVLGRKAATAPFVASAVDDLVAWVSPGDAPELVLHDAAADREVGRLGLERVAQGRQSRPIAIERGRVLYETNGAGYSWAPGGDPERLERDGLLDFAGSTTVFQEAARIDMVQSIFNVDFLRPGEGAAVSPDGAYVLTRAPGDWSPGQPFSPLLYDARSGDRLPSGIGADELALDASFGDRDTVVYVVGQVGDLSGGPDLDGTQYPLLTLRSCLVGTDDCQDIVPQPRAGERPLLAH